MDPPEALPGEDGARKRTASRVRQLGSVLPAPDESAVSVPPSDAAPAKVRRPRLLQEDVPGSSLDQALRVARAIADSYAYKPTRPMHVAAAMKMSPTSGPFRGLTGAAIAYGLTSGGAWSGEIAITPLGMRIVRPTVEGDELAGRREALLRPKVVGEFLRQYDGAPLPSDVIAKNVLTEKGVPQERVDEVLQLIVDGAASVGFLQEIGGKRWVDLSGATVPTKTSDLSGSTPKSSTAGAPSPASTHGPAVAVSPAIQVNVEIHIAADASSQVIEDIFKNMRRYVLSSDGPVEE